MLPSLLFRTYGPSLGPAMGLLRGPLWAFFGACLPLGSAIGFPLGPAIGFPLGPAMGLPLGACYMGLPLGLLWDFLWACCGPSFAACYMGLPLVLLWAFLWGLLCLCIHGLHGEHILRVLHSLWQRTHLALIFITLAQDTFCIYFHDLYYAHGTFPAYFHIIYWLQGTHFLSVL